MARKKPTKQCGAKTRSGGSCGNSAGMGTDHVGFGRCKLHGGNTPSGKKNGRHLMAEHAATTLGLPIEGRDPAEVVLSEIAHLSGEVEWYRIQVRRLDRNDVIWGVTKQIAKQATEHPGVDTVEEAKVNPWVDLLGKAQDRLLRACEVAHRMGIEERRIRLAEEVGELVGETLRAVLAGLDLTEEQADRARELVPAQLRALAERIDPSSP
jgi:hypothetical protein